MLINLYTNLQKLLINMHRKKSTRNNKTLKKPWITSEIIALVKQKNNYHEESLKAKRL